MSENDFEQESQIEEHIFNCRMEIGKRVEKARKLIGLSQFEFAKNLGFKQSYLSRIEFGTVNCLVDMIYSMHDIYGISPNYIILGYDPIFISNKSLWKQEKEIQEKEHMINFKVEIGKRIKEARQSINLSQFEFAKNLGFKQSYLSRIEFGTVNCLVDMIYSMHDIYGISPNYIILGYDPIFISNKSLWKQEMKIEETLKREKEKTLKKISKFIDSLY